MKRTNATVLPAARFALVGLLALLAACLATRSGVGAIGVDIIATPDTANNVGRFTSLALDGAGNPVVSYLDITTGNLKVLHCGNSSCTNGNTIATPATFGSTGHATSIKLDSLGRPVVAYFDSAINMLKVLHCGNATCTAGNSIASPTGSSTGIYASLALDGLGKPVVAYQTFASDGDLSVLHCGDANCTSGNSITSPDTATDVGYFVSLTLDTSGNPVVSYHSLTNFDFKLLHCGNANCTAGNTITLPDTSGEVGLHTSLALDGVGKPVISYQKTIPDYDLEVMHCGDSTCTAGNSITSPDTAGHVGGHTSMKLDASDNPVVSYYDTTNANLRLLHCNDANCAGGGDIIATPDSAGDVGQDTSLVLDASGNPVVSYYDATNGDLKVLHCGSPTCDTPKPLTGDVNDDGIVDSLDALLILQFDARMLDELANPAAADANGDGRTNSIDASLVLQYTAGLVPRLPPLSSPSARYARRQRV